MEKLQGKERQFNAWCTSKKVDKSVKYNEKEKSGALEDHCTVSASL